jgi:multidrug efflux pump
MGGIEGRLFREFAVTLSVAITISLAVSLTTTPMMCAYLLAPRREDGHGRLYRAGEQAFAAILDVYDRSLRRALRWPGLVMLSLLATLCFAVHLFINVPKGYMPEQDNGRIWGGIQADQSISFQLMKRKLAQFVEIVRQDPAVAKVVGFYGGSSSYGYAFAALKPLSDR